MLQLLSHNDKYECWPIACYIVLKRHQGLTVWLESDDHARHSPSLVRCVQGWALKRRQAVIFGQPNGLFLTFAGHNSAICHRESLSVSHSSMELKMAAWGSYSAAEYWTGCTWTLLLFVTYLFLIAPTPPLHSTLFYFIQLSVFKNLPQGALPSAKHTSPCRALIQIRKNSHQNPFNREKRMGRESLLQDEQTCNQYVSLLL